MGDSRKNHITVTVHTAFLPEQSDLEQERYVFAYTVTITNTGTMPAQLVSRHWIITDADERVQEVRGIGVVGEQPLLKPGESFEYTSGTALNTAVGTMQGTYQMIAENGEHFDAEIPPFVLAMPRTLH